MLRQFDRSRRFAALVQYHQKRALRYGFQQAFFFSRHALSRIYTRAAFLWLDFFQRIIENKRPSESRMYPVRLFQTAFQ
ncbi:Uncharacterised protein [Mycobacteroides abscessus subsp. massiliense]|nr:Uncharacterised protein [Mycobacteroides abscessus subsp. massiliense]